MKISSGILLYRCITKELEVMLVHPGGPFWKMKDIGAWSIPKGGVERDADYLDVAKREFNEETGRIIEGEFIPLKPVKLKGGKIVHAWACEYDLNTENLASNTIALEWPPKSGRTIQIPEIDKWEWYSIAEATVKINPGQLPFLAELNKILLTK